MRLSFRILSALLLALVMAGCRADIDVTLEMESSGAGVFRIAFAFDREFVSVVEASKEGKASLDQLRAVESLGSDSAWSYNLDQSDGGLSILITRHFNDPESLENVLASLADSSEGPFAFLSIFRDLRLDLEPGLFSTRSRLSGSVDLTPERLAPGVEIDPEVRAAFEQAGREAFRFAVTAELPGRVARFGGDPEKVSGGTIEWRAALGRTLRFSAEASALRAQAVVPAAALGLSALVAAIAMVLRVRRRRSAPVPGWEPEPTVNAED